MAKQLRKLDSYLEERRTTTAVTFYGQRAADRYDDDDLAVLATFPALTTARLVNQRITHVPRGMRGLTDLYLSSNASLASLDGIEDCLTLQKLTLTNLPALDLEKACAVLAELPELTELLLFDDVPAAIAKLPSLIELSTNDGAIERIAKIRTLRRLRLSCAKLPDAFAKLPRLEALEISNAMTIPPSIAKLASLEELVISTPKLRALPAAIGKLPKLKRLVAEKTSIATIPDELCGLRSLELLDLSTRQLRSIPAAIGKLTNLRVLDLALTQVKKLPDSIGDLANLRVLRLPYKHVATPASFAKLSLEEFSGDSDLEALLTLRPAPTPEHDNVDISEPARIPADFGDPVQLDVNLGGDTKQLPQLDKLRRLKSIELDVGDLADAFKRLASAPHLTTLSIDGVRRDIPEELGLLVGLTELAIDSGDTMYPERPGTLTKLPKSLGTLAKLVWFKLARHRLAVLPPQIGELAALAHLAIHAHGLTALSPALGKLTRLERFDLSHAEKVVKFPDLSRCTKLVEIAITDGPKLANLEILGKLPALRELYFYGDSISNKAFAKLVPALANGPLEVLYIQRTDLTKLPPGIGKLTKLRDLRLPYTIRALPTEIRGCTGLRRIELNREIGKDQLPPGRWKKHFRSGDTWFERTD